jgi:hypothetical protein
MSWNIISFLVFYASVVLESSANRSIVFVLQCTFQHRTYICRPISLYQIVQKEGGEPFDRYASEIFAFSRCGAIKPLTLWVTMCVVKSELYMCWMFDHASHVCIASNHRWHTPEVCRLRGEQFYLPAFSLSRGRKCEKTATSNNNNNHFCFIMKYQQLTFVDKMRIVKRRKCIAILLTLWMANNCMLDFLVANGVIQGPA